MKPVNLPFATLIVDTTGPDPRRDRVRGVSATIVDVTGRRKNLDARVDVELRTPTKGDVLSNEDGLTPRPWREVAVEIRQLVSEHRIVTHDASRSLSVLAAEGVLLPRQPIDLAELASIVVPGVASTDIIALCVFLGIPVPSSRQVNADLLAEAFGALLGRIAEYDEGTLDRLLLHVRDGGWTFADLFNPDLVMANRVRGSSTTLSPPELLFMRERTREEPLAATGSLQQVNHRAVEEILGSEGTLSRVVAGFERRPQQERMALAVADAINEQGQLLVEAGNGTGEKLAHFLPAALPPAERGGPAGFSAK